MADIFKNVTGGFSNLNNAAQQGKDLVGGIVSTTTDVAGIEGKLKSQLGSATESFISSAKSKLPKIPGLSIDPSGESKMGSDGVNADGIPVVNVTGKRPQNTKDFRVRISPQVDAYDQVYGPLGENNILTPLRATQGLMFPYTPSISWNQSVEYTATSLTHSNQDSYTYKNTPSTMISLDGEFTVQNQREGEYLLAVMHFLRTVSKMYFGEASFAAPSTGQPSLAGMPPPVLIFSGYGDYMFNDLPVIVKDHSYSMKDNISYVDINTAGGSVRLPAIINISIKLVVQTTPKRNRKEFDLNKFRTGELMKKGGWI